LGLVLVGLWVQRAPLAENLINRELAARGVAMRYRIADIGPRTQRIEDIVLGDPHRPDLTARWVELDIAVTTLWPTISAIRAGGVRLRGTLHNGTLRLGEVDRFLPTTRRAGGNALPALDLMLDDARASIATDYGALGLVANGRGNLRNGFAARVAAVVPAARFGACIGKGLLAHARIAVRDGKPEIDGPLSAHSFGCREAGLELQRPAADVRFRLDETLSAWTANVAAKSHGLRVAGHMTAKPARIDAEATSNASEEGTLLSASGQFAFDDIAAGERDPLAGLRDAAAGTPVAPLALRLSDAVKRASGRNRLAGRFAITTTPSRTDVQLSDVRFASASGAQFAMAPDTMLLIHPKLRQWRYDGVLAFGGGGLPDGQLMLRRDARGALHGRAALTPYAQGESRMALSPVMLDADPSGGVTATTTATIDGPLTDGAVQGLTMPIKARWSGNGRWAIDEECELLSWRTLRLSSLVLDPARISVCPAHGALVRSAGRGIAGGVRTGPLLLKGHLGRGAFSVAARSVEADLDGARFALAAPATVIGSGDNAVRIGAARLDGAMRGDGVSGKFSDGNARIGTVMLDFGQMQGGWQFANGVLYVTGAARISDREQAVRFNPVRSPDVRLRLANGKITGTGHMRNPVRGPEFARVDVSHELSSGKGRANIILENLRFGDQLQPDDLTPAALGVVANVEGGVEGQGTILWDDHGATSTGHFSTSGMNLAAAFGPVRGLSTTIDFTNLLGLETAPGQIATVASINPGVEVLDGRVRYQLQPGNKVRVEGAEWPFSGGRLILLPTTLDFDARHPRSLTFRVTGLEAGAFINTLELKNVSATGLYDGLLPMIFDASGGRIEGGILVARQQGYPALVVESARTLTARCDPEREAGTLSYVGEVSNAEMGGYGRLAFDALKHLRYKCLTILLDGAIDGEFVTQIAINGVNQGSTEAQQSMLVRPFLGLPLIFNVRITAPFRGLLQSFVDPSLLIRNSLGPQYQSVLNNGLAVQPPDSEKKLPREGE
jgi:hypothetical protein